MAIYGIGLFLLVFPARIFSVKAVIFCGGNLEKGFFVNRVLQNAELIVAADIGAKTAVNFGLFPQAVVGDFDSLEVKTFQKIKNRGIKMIAANRKKDETDTELAINYALEKGAKEITILGGTKGNRLDHVLANLFFSARKDACIKFVNGSQISWIEKGPKKIVIKGNQGDLLSLLALSRDVTMIESSGLQYPLNKNRLSLGQSIGISNIFLTNDVKINFQKGLLFIAHTHLTK